MDMALSVAASGDAILLSTCHRPGLMVVDGEAAWAPACAPMAAQTSKLRRSREWFMLASPKRADPSIRHGKRGTLANVLQTVIGFDAAHVHAGDAALVGLDDFIAQVIEFQHFAHGRHVFKVRQQEAGQ